MSKRIRRRWVTKCDVNNIKIEMERYVRVETCAEEACSTLLFFNAPGGDDGEEFWVLSCTCEEGPAMCCTAHVDTYKCPDCADDKKDYEEDDEEEEEEEETSSKEEAK